MEFEIPTYEEYKKATRFARFKYRFGIFISILCLICFIILIVFVITYSEQLSTNPLLYGVKKLGVSCNCYSSDGSIRFIVDEEGFYPDRISYNITNFSIFNNVTTHP